MPTPSNHSGRDGFFRSKRFKNILFSGALVMLAAGVILVVSSLPMLKHAPSTDPIQVTAPADDYSRALSAAASGDTTTAVTLLKAAVAADPKNTAASTKLAELSGAAAAPQPSSGTPSTGTTPPSSGSGGSPTGPSAAAPDNSAYLKPIKNLSTLLPTIVGGYKVSPAENQGATSVTTAEPLSGRAAFGKLTMVEYTVLDRTTASEASKYIGDVSKKVYGKNADTHVAITAFTGYYGTNGGRGATVVFVRGRYVFELLATSATSDANAQKVLIISAASAFPALWD